jgi:nucleoside-diphosphate-sugar epimerase
MRVVVTGANGLIGRHFIEHCADEYDITALTRNEVVPAHSCENVVWVSTDYSQASLADIFSHADAILHLASIRPYVSSDCYLENIELDTHVFKAANEAGVSNVVCTSSCSVYGHAPTPWIETDERSPQTEYALSKAVSETSATYFNSKYDMKIKMLRLAQVLSHLEFEGGMLRTFFDHASQGKELKVTVCGLFREYIYVLDVVSALSSALQSRNINGIFNVGTGTKVSIDEIAESVATAFDRKQLVSIDENRKNIAIDSLMDSSKFYKQFSWKPEFSFQTAINDIVKKYY